MCAAALPLSMHPSSRSSELGPEFAADARQDLALSQPSGDFSKIQQLMTLAVLAVYEGSRSNGLQAWYDLTTANSILPCLKYDPMIAKDRGMMAVLDVVHVFLQVSMTLHSVGQSVQFTGVASFEAKKSVEAPWQSEGSSFRSEVLLQLSSLFRRCLILHRKHLPGMNPAPWARDSPFMALKKELDSFYIMHAGGFISDAEVVEALQQQETGAGVHILCLSILYTMRILLDAVFMPVAVIPAADPTAPSPSDTSDDAADPAMSSPSRRRLAYFPGAPEPFWCEKTASSIRSARAITLLARSIMEQESFLLPPFLGYSLFLAGLVFLNQLQAEASNIRIEEFIDYLKTIFTVLGAMRPFFAPAHLWLDTLFQVHSFDTLSELVVLSSGPGRIFSNFFSRFHGITEPPFCPLKLAEPSVERRGSSPITPLQRCAAIRTSQLTGTIVNRAGTLTPERQTMHIPTTTTNIFASYRNTIGAALGSTVEADEEEDEVIASTVSNASSSQAATSSSKSSSAFRAVRRGGLPPIRSHMTNHPIPVDCDADAITEVEIGQLPSPLVATRGHDALGAFVGEIEPLIVHDVATIHPEFSLESINIEQALLASNGSMGCSDRRLSMRGTEDATDDPQIELFGISFGPVLFE
ncbi:hypothetical protein GQ53DRAFT_847941 [Thozetella sp. PMI_491]|nr:hypothetical protein GQ53DRAFT_847941 [Thozetella sp. PMI_491]